MEELLVWVEMNREIVARTGAATPWPNSKAFNRIQNTHTHSVSSSSLYGYLQKKASLFPILSCVCVYNS